MENYLGKHLVVDATCGEGAKEILANFPFFYNLLENLPKLIDMTAITPPFILKHLNSPDPAWGLTGFIVIATSHISFHTFPEKGNFHFDMFSCEPFDDKEVVCYLDGIFNFVDSKVQVLDR